MANLNDFWNEPHTDYTKGDKAIVYTQDGEKEITVLEVSEDGFRIVAEDEKGNKHHEHIDDIEKI